MKIKVKYIESRDAFGEVQSPKIEFVRLKSGAIVNYGRSLPF